MAAADLLERHGVEVVFPEDQTCCGQPAFNSGYRAEARTIARHFLDVFWPLVNEGAIDAIVVPSGSCAAMVTHFYPVLFEDGEDAQYERRANDVSRATYELTQYLVDILGVNTTGASCAKKIAYHPCCHLLRGLRVDEQPRRLLNALKDSEIVELPGAEECCGFGGLFALKNAEISSAMGRRKAENLLACNADLLAVCDVSCMAHLNGILKRQGHSCRAVHVAELLRGEAVELQHSETSNGTHSL